MKQLLLLFGFVFFIYACKDLPQERMIAFHDVINDIIENQIDNPEPIILELVENRQEYSYLGTEDPSGNSIYWEESIFDSLFKQGFIDSSDVKYMVNQLNSSHRYKIDTLRINRHTIRKKELDSLLIKVGYDSTLQYLKSKYSSRSILVLSNPIFSEDGKKILINADCYCGRLCGAQIRFLYGKKGDKWTLLLKDEYGKS